MADIFFSQLSPVERHLIDTSAGGLLVTEGIIRPVVNAAALTWFIRISSAQ